MPLNGLEWYFRSTPSQSTTQVHKLLSYWSQCDSPCSRNSCEVHVSFYEAVQLIPVSLSIYCLSYIMTEARCCVCLQALPGQVQTYYINELKNNEEPAMGALVSKLPFTHPTFIITTIALLRQQLMLNTMILSCVRSTSSATVNPRK